MTVLSSINNLPSAAVASSRIPSLDGLRAIAIGIVLFAHGASTVSTDNPIYQLIVSYLGNGRFGVVLFFVLSGYLITTLMKREIEKTSQFNLQKFHYRRFFRILPVFLLYLITVTFLANRNVITLTPEQIFFTSCFLINYSHIWLDTSDPSYWFLGHFWCLAIEIHFYLIWPLVLVYGGFRRALQIAVAVVLLSPAIRLLTYLLFPSVQAHITVMTHTSLDPLMLGAIVALVQDKARFQHFAEKIFKIPHFPLLCVCLIFLSRTFDLAFDGMYYLPLGYALDSLLFAALTHYYVSKPHGQVGRILNSHLLASIGLISYSLYVWQQLFLTELNLTWLGSFPVNYVVVFVVATTSYLCIEKPFLKLR
jgi:peptidoglycan/LPS O-acetylase OafA/YrhL